MTKIVLITGCLGFIGQYVTQSCLNQGWYVIGVDAETYAADKTALINFSKFNNFNYLKLDINDLTRLYDADYIINLAAESDVDSSIINSAKFLHSNINGVHNILRLINSRPKNAQPILLQFSTDEVYGDIVNGAHFETDQLNPSNPYAATKASADLLIKSYHRTYNIPYIIVRPTNNYGIGQTTEKFLPKTLKYLSLGRLVPLHEQGTPIRTWLHAEDTANAIITIIRSGIVNETYNISGNYECTNLHILKKILELTHNTKDHLPFVDFTVNRPGQDVRYSINDDKIRQLGWTNIKDFNIELPSIVNFYTSNFIW